MNFSNEVNGSNYEATLERLGGDVELLCEIAALVLVECPQILENIREAVLTGNAGAVHRAAHTMKGTVSSIGAVTAYHWANQLEQHSRSGNLDEATLLLGNLDEALKCARPTWLALAEQHNRSVRA